MKLLVTGGAGFIGSNFIRHILGANSDIQVVNLDCLTYAGNLKNLVDVATNSRYTFFKGDITSCQDVAHCMAQGIDEVINFAAETHVDRSILDSSAFVRTNVEGVQVLLEACREGKVSRFIQVSTDEIYGSLDEEGRFTEESPYAPNSPYAASKAAVLTLTKALAIELAGDNIRVNALTPVASDTPLFRDFLGDGAEQKRTEIEAAIPLGRLGLPSDMAACAAFLASDEACFLTGISLPVDGGWTAS